jgi:hypothetical protein
MAPQEILQWKKLLGEEWTEEEIQLLIREEPELDPKLLCRLFHEIQEVPVAPLNLSAKILARLPQRRSFLESVQALLWKSRFLSFAFLAIFVLGLGFYMWPSGTPLLESVDSGVVVQEATTPEGKVFQVRFSIRSPQAHSIAMAGDFNQWQEQPLVLNDSKEGLFSTELLIPPGSYSYAFIVDGKNWMPDPGSYQTVPDGFGNQNSLIHL